MKVKCPSSPFVLQDSRASCLLTTHEALKFRRNKNQ